MGLEVGFLKGFRDVGLFRGRLGSRLEGMRGFVGGGDKCFEGLVCRRCVRYGRRWLFFLLLFLGFLCLLVFEMRIFFC